MTFNQITNIIRDFANSHKQINSFGIGEEHEINASTQLNRTYPMLWIIPIDSLTKTQTKERTFEFLCFDLVNKDESNENEVLSDCEQIIDDFIKKLINNSNNYNVVGEPQLFPFTEKYMDEVTGWRSLITIETDHYTENDCDVPIEDE